MKIVVQPEIVIELPEVKILAVRDVFHERRIIARVEGLPRGVVLWGPQDYDTEEARTWNNHTAWERALDVLAFKNVPFE
jgi:hypothetical protein